MSRDRWAYSDAEIAVMYRQAKNPRDQITIIADLCNRTKDQVEERLVALGCELPKMKKRFGQRVKPRNRKGRSIANAD